MIIDDLTNADIKNVLSFSGGKDSTALLLHAIERGIEFDIVFADTGHEHDITYEYLDYIEQTLGVEIRRVRADFAAQIETKRKYVKKHWHKDKTLNLFGTKAFRRGLTEDEINSTLDKMMPSGNPMEDLLRAHGRAPAPMMKFCSMELKQQPVFEQIYQPLVDDGYTVVNWQGVRAQESNARSGYMPAEISDIDVEFIVYRPILLWTHDDVFRMHKKHNIKWNPLYDMGMSRVGCMPCICSSRGELIAISQRLPEAIERVAKLETILAESCRHPDYKARGFGVFMPASTQDSNGLCDGIYDYIGKLTNKDQCTFDFGDEDVDVCNAVYPIICE